MALSRLSAGWRLSGWPLACEWAVSAAAVWSSSSGPIGWVVLREPTPAQWLLRVSLPPNETQPMGPNPERGEPRAKRGAGRLLLVGRETRNDLAHDEALHGVGSLVGVHGLDVGKVARNVVF